MPNKPVLEFITNSFLYLILVEINRFNFTAFCYPGQISLTIQNP